MFQSLCNLLPGKHQINYFQDILLLTSPIHYFQDLQSFNLKFTFWMKNCIFSRITTEGNVFVGCLSRMWYGYRVCQNIEESSGL